MIPALHQKKKISLKASGIEEQFPLLFLTQNAGTSVLLHNLKLFSSLVKQVL